MLNKLKLNSRRNQLFLLYGVGALLLVMASGLWYYKNSTNPEHAFWATIGQGLRTSGVTIKAAQKSTASNVSQSLQYSVGYPNLSYSRTHLTQPGTIVVSEMLGTEKADYTRYVKVDTNQKNKDGKALDFSKVIGVWAKSPEHQQFVQAAMGTGLPLGGMVVPIANLDKQRADKVMDQIKSDGVYKIDFSKAKSERVGGRLQITYQADIQPVPYARLMKTFAQTIGLHDLDELDPATFQGQPSLPLSITIDAKSRHVVTIALPKNDYQQTYSSYDVPLNQPIPSKTITTTELQKRLSEL